MAASVQILSKDSPDSLLLDEKRTATTTTLSSSSEPTPTRSYSAAAASDEVVTTTTTESSNAIVSPEPSNTASAAAENTPAPASDPVVDTSTKPTGDEVNQKNNIVPDDNVIDSALLSALSDQRERFALLRLEQTLVDFTKDSSRQDMQVGGPNNSIVILSESSAGEVLATPIRGKQTSFQRLCLHRLADRFNIVREVVENSNYGGGPGLIRLVKVKNQSRIPKKLLIDLDASDYANAAQLARLDSSNMENNNNDVTGLTHSLSATALSDRISGSLVVPKTPPKKMTIMKRGSSSFGSTGSLRGKDGGYSSSSGNKSKIKGKNLSDKEKAYAEARARIFNESTSSLHEAAGETAVASSEQPPQLQANNSIMTPSASALSSAVTSPSITPPPPQPLQPTHSASTTSSPSPPLSETAAAVATPDICTLEEQQQQQQDGVKLNRPAAATSGGVSKVTWRNRRQEENDPDFQRLRVAHHGAVAYHGMHSSSDMGAAAYGGGAVGYHLPAAQVPYHAPQHYYVQQQQPQPQAAAPQAQQAYYGQPPGTAAFYHASQMQQQKQQPAPKNWTPQGRGGGGRGGGYGAQQQWSYNNAGRGGDGGKQRGGANVNSMDDFPKLG